jgi:hypothetical protein
MDRKKLKEIIIKDLSERNRDLKNARSNATLGIIAIIVAFWTIVASVISQVLNSKYPVMGYLENSNNLSSPSNISCDLTIIRPDPHTLWFLISNHPFDYVWALGIIVTILLLIILRDIINSRYKEEIANNETLRKLTHLREISLEEAKENGIDEDFGNITTDKYFVEIPKEEKNYDRFTLFIIEVLWFFGMFAIIKIPPFSDGGAPISFIPGSIACSTGTGSSNFWIIFVIGGAILWLIWECFVFKGKIYSIIKEILTDIYLNLKDIFIM